MQTQITYTNTKGLLLGLFLLGSPRVFRDMR